MRRNFPGPGGRYENLDEPCPLDLSRDPAENMRDLLYQITSKELMSTAKRMGYVNNFTKLIQSVGENTNLGYSQEDIIKCLLLSLVSTAKEVRAAGLRAFRHMFTSEKMLSKMLEFRIDIFLTRSMDMVHAFEVERVQALRFIRKVISLCPRQCPMSLATCLVSVGNDEGDDADRLKRACVATLCELAIKNVATASYCGGINTIIRNVLDSQVQRFNESLMATLLYLLNTPESRPYVRRDVGLESILAPFTDLHYRHNPDTPETHLRDEKANRLQASKMAIVTIFRSWSGIISLCRPDGKGVQSLLGVFCLPNSDVRKGVMDILFEIFQLKEPDWTDDFHLALLSIDPCQMQDSWKLSEGFVAEEAKALLPHRASGRTNLVMNYLALVLAAFMNAGLFESLVEVITSSDPFISVRATILLGELLHLANTLLPPECSTHTHCVPLLVNTASSFEVSSQERSRASVAVNCLDRLHQTKKRGLEPCSLYLNLITTKAHTLEPKVKPDKLHRDRLTACLNKEIDDPLFSAIRDTQVMMEKDFRNWDWDLIGSTLQSPAVTLKKLEETSNQKFVRNLLYFYKPSSQRFCTVHISDPQARMFSEVGCLLIDFLLESDDVEGLPILQELVQNIGECLKEALSPSITTGVLSNNNVLSTISRDYFLFLGKLACTKNGSKLLERTGIYQYVLDLCSLPSRDSLLKLIVASLDYSHSGIPRIILSKILTASNVTTRLYATSHMRVLLRARVAFFHSWGLEFLVTQLYDTDTQVASEAVDVLDEACEDEANLQYLVQLRPVLLHLGEKGLRLLTRFLSIEKGFNYLSQLGYLTPLLDSWRTHYTEAYVRWVEELLAESLTSYVKQKDENTFIRRSNKRLALKDAFLPPHVYGQLVQKKSGFKLLQKTNDVELFARTLQTVEPNTRENIVTLKATLWALGHIGCTTWGINFLVDEAIIPEIVRLAEECENYAIRGTCYYALGLIAKTREGADILRDLEWESVRHLGKEKWPVLEDEVENKEELMPFSYSSVENLSSTPSTGSMLTSFRLTGISESDRVGGVFLGDETKTSEGSTAYDKLSGIYLGEDMGSSRKPPREDTGEVGILSRWYQDAERRRKIATRESGFYDEISGVYLGEEASSSATPSSERNVTPSPGGILERLYSSSGLGSSVSTIDSKPSHRRNFSEGDFTAAKFHEKNSPGNMEAKLKKRAFSNAERVMVATGATVALFNDRSGQTSVSERRPHKLSEETLAINTPTGSSVGIRTFSETSMDSTNKMDSRSRSRSDATDLPLPIMHIRTSSNLSSASADNKLDSRSRSGSDATDLLNMHIRTSSNLSSASADNKLDSRSRSGSDATDLSNMHIRTSSNLSSASVDSGDYLEMAYLASRSRTSSASETGVYPQHESPTYRSSTSINSDDTSKIIGEKDGLMYSSGESSQGGTSYEVTPPPSLSTDGQLRDFTRTSTGTTLFSDKEERKPTLAGEFLQNDLETRQRSVSLTEKRRLGSPSLGIIPETRCSSFHGSTEFSKIASQGHASSEVELLHVPPIENLNDFNGSSSSLAEVKILSDKTIVFHSGSEAKSRAMSIDSATVSDLRRERLLVGNSQLSGDESEGGSYKSMRSRGSSFERADLARKLGLKTGDISRPVVSRTRSTSSGGSTSEGCLKRKIVNRNRLVSSIENCAVISSDLRKNSLASPETAPFTSTRDAFGYSALSTLRRQRSFNRDLEAKVSAFGAARVSPGAWMMTRSMSAVESPNYSKRESLSAISSAFDFRQLKPSAANTGNEFLGLCLPVDLSALFQTEHYDFQGSWPDHFVCTPTIQPLVVVNTGETLSPHDRSRCLGCLHSNRAGTGGERSRSSDQLLDGWSRKLAPLIETKFESVYSTSSGFFSTTSMINDSLKDAPTNRHKVDEKAAEGRALMRQEILRIVLSLSSIVASRSHQEELVKLKEMFSHMFEDLCLYCEVSDILGLYKFKIHIRRFIQGLFSNVNFDSIVEQADLVVSRGRRDSSFTR